MPVAVNQNLQFLLFKYKHLDPSKHSFNDEFGRIRKRTCLQNFLHRLVCLLSFGLKSNNPALDRATEKLICCAHHILKNDKPDAAGMRDLKRLISLHVCVIKRNCGKKQDDLYQLLFKINRLMNAPVVSKTVERQVKEKNLVQFFEAYFTKGYGGDWSNLPEASDVEAIWPRTFAVLQARFPRDCEIHMGPYYLLKAARSFVLESESEKKRYLPAIAKLVGLFMPSQSWVHDPDWWKLVPYGDCTFQARTIKTVIEDHLQGINTPAQQLAQLNNVSLSVWKKAGELSKLNVWNSNQLNSLFQSLRPEYLMAFLNGAVSVAENKSAITKFLGHMIQPHRDAIPRIDAWPWEQLSDQVWELFDINQVIPSSTFLHPLQNRDILWYGLSQHLNHPHTDRQKRLFLHFSQKFFERDLLLVAPVVKAFFQALTPADIAVMPLEKYHPAHRFLLALCSQSLANYSAILKMTARNMNPQEMTVLQTLCRSFPVSIQEKMALVELLKEPAPLAQPTIVQQWMGEMHMQKHGLMIRFAYLVKSNQWQEAWDFVQRLDDQTRDYFLKAIRQQALPKDTDIKALNKPLFFMALFDSKARGNMLKMLQEGLAGDSFIQWALEMKELSQKDGLPESVQKIIVDFFKDMRREVHVGSLKCPLRDQYNNPAQADLEVKLLQEAIPAHKALLSLDPFFKAFLSPQNKEVVIPADKVPEARLRLKWLYNRLTMVEIAQPATQLILKTMKNLKPSLAALFNKKESADILVQGGDGGEGVHANRFILESAFPFFAVLFQIKMKESKEPLITLEEMSQGQVKAVLEYLYTSEKPDFNDAQSEEAFQQAWKFLKASEKPARFKR